MSASSWYQVFSESSGFHHESLLEDLGKAGIKLTSYDPRLVAPEAAESYGLVFCSNLAHHVPEFLRHASSCGRHRIIAVVSFAGLGSHETW